MINRQVLKRKAVSQHVLEFSCTQTNRQTVFTAADPQASLIAQLMTHQMKKLINGLNHPLGLHVNYP